MKETKWYCRYLVGSDPTGITGIKSEACAFINNSIGPNGGLSVSMNSADDTTAFVDVYLNYLACDIQPTVSIDDCYTTCATDIIGMHMTANRGTPQKSIVRVFDEAFNKIGPLLTEKVVVRPSLQKGSMKLELKGKVPIASQKYEVSIQNEGDKTKMNPEIEFVNGKCTLTSPSPTFNLDFSTSYTITSIVVVDPSSSSTPSNAFAFPSAP